MRALILRALTCAVLAILSPPATTAPAPRHRPAGEALVTVRVSLRRAVNRFIPSRALGAGLDGHSIGETARKLSRANVRAMLSAGLTPLSYRLRTELAGEAWHWNPEGSWSDAAHAQGYWTSSSKPGRPIRACYGYRLPRRGNTIDQANDDGYSRIDDGDVRTFWKSNPYLSEHFSGEKDSVNPQWVMVDLGRPRPIDAARILWSQPFATDYSIEFGAFVGEEDLSQRLPTEWHAFPAAAAVVGRGGNALLRLSAAPLTVRYVRIVLRQGSGTAPRDATDIRDRLGYAIRELYLGTLDARGRFADAVEHGRGRHRQSAIYVSSTDPWHRATDRDEEIEQPGFDTVFESGLTHGRALLVPVPVLYDTPENAAAEVRYLLDRGYPVDRIEMGEEPDGQFVAPEHYGALYLQFEKAIHDIAPGLHLGGPSLQDIEQSEVPGRIELGKAGWMRRFLAYLGRAGRLDRFSFFSFEWYPFEDDCHPGQLVKGARKLTDALRELQEGGLTHDVPWVMSEYGYSAFGARAEVDLDGALLNADSVGRFLALGGDAAYLYGYEGNEIIREQDCSSGNNMLFFTDLRGHVTARTASYWGARLLTQQWAQPGDGLHEVYPAVSDVRDGEGDELVTAYAVHRPDGLWSLLLINKDPKRSYRPELVFGDARSDRGGFVGRIETFQYSRDQYRLGGRRDAPYPVRSVEPVHRVFRSVAGAPTQVLLPPLSMTVVRGEVGASSSISCVTPQRVRPLTVRRTSPCE